MTVDTLPAPRSALPPPQPVRAHQDPWWVRWTLTTLALGVILILIVVPVANVFAHALSIPTIIADVQAATGPKWEAFSRAVGVSLAQYWANLFQNEDTVHSIVLTLSV